MWISTRLSETVVHMWKYKNKCPRKELILDILDKVFWFTRNDFHLDEIKHYTVRLPDDLKIWQPDLALASCRLCRNV